MWAVMPKAGQIVKMDQEHEDTFILKGSRLQSELESVVAMDDG